jgi:hypothetical protein
MDGDGYRGIDTRPHTDEQNLLGCCLSDDINVGVTVGGC